MIAPLTRRHALAGITTLLPAGARAARTLRLGHGFPGGDAGDFRDQLARRFARGIAERTGDALACNVFPDSTVLPAAAPLAAVAAAQPELGLFPLADAAGAVPALDIALMPGLVTSYAAALSWKTTPAGAAVAALLDEAGVVILCWVWQALGLAVRPRAVLAPVDAATLQLRGGGPAMDAMLKAAGARPTVLAADGLYTALQRKVVDGAVLSSTAMISRRLEEVARNVTAPADCFGMSLSALVIAKSVFLALPTDQQAVLRDVATGLEAFAGQAAQADDDRLAALYLAAAAPVQTLGAADRRHWTVLATKAQAAFSQRSPRCAAMLTLAR